MTNNPKLIKQVIDNIKKLSKEDLDKVMKEADKWYNKEVIDTNVDDIENLKTLLFQDNLTQYGKRKLIEYYEEKIKELENYINPSKARISYFDTKKGANVVIEGFIPKQKIEEKLEKRKNRLIKAKRTYTNKIRMNELNLIKRILLEDK